ncbi:hypothetical protein BSIN_2453 [Burkholderia singularis]|uniref:Uncharacterized protein n=1 Tax=Burkholderia singularis TaxID=1503053 RepID=A0A238H1Z2_9BURK|nr:hypothetical protein BSIN_2453 [Burkholderia singularis]
MRISGGPMPIHLFILVRPVLLSMIVGSRYSRVKHTKIGISP